MFARCGSLDGGWGNDHVVGGRCRCGINCRFYAQAPPEAQLAITYVAKLKRSPLVECVVGKTADLRLLEHLLAVRLIGDAQSHSQHRLSTQNQ